MKREEAKVLWRNLEETERETRLRLALLGGWILVLWGGIWVMGSLLTAWSPGMAERFWTVASPLGGLLSFYLGFRQGAIVRTPLGLQTFYFWSLLTLFFLLHWIFLLPPKGLEGESFLISLVAFAYAYVGTLWQIPGITWAGLGLFALDLLLFRLFPEYFHLGIGLVGLLGLAYGGRLLWRWTR